MLFACVAELPVLNSVTDSLAANRTQSRQYVKITDFGWAHDQTTLGRSQSFAGTASGCYMAPEVRSRHNKARGQGASYDGTKADVWSCGVVLYKMICVRDPFDGGFGLDQEDQEHTIHDPASRGIKFSPSLASLFRFDAPSLLSRDPTVRLSAVQAVYQPWLREGMTSLRASLGQLSPSLMPTSPGPPKRGIVGTAAAAVAVAASAGAAALRKAPTSPGPPIFSSSQPGSTNHIPPLTLDDSELSLSLGNSSHSSIGAAVTGGGFWVPGDNEDDDDMADYGGFYFDQRAARDFKAKSDAKSQASQVQWQYERGPVGGKGGADGNSGKYADCDHGGTGSRASSVGSSVGLPYESWGGNDSWGGLSVSSVDSKEERSTPTS